MNTTIILTTDDAELFKEYMQYRTPFYEFLKNRDIFIMMQEKGAFNMTYGKVTLTYQEGKLISVNKDEIIYYNK